MAEIKFHKMVASGNDFIVIDNRSREIKNPKRFAEQVCQPHLGIGADGVLLIERSRKADLFLRIFNPDGSEAEACGNGYRCVGLYAHECLGFSKKVLFETLAGNIEVHVGTSRIKVKTQDPSDYRKRFVIDDLPVYSEKRQNSIAASFVNTGVPHVVIFAEGLEKIPVDQLGRAIRYHKMFQPKGTNVNFVEVTGDDSLALRTYERGVEAETLACGTGTIASAVVANLTGRVGTAVKVKTKSGEALDVRLERSGKQVKNVFLEGGAQFVFDGKLVNTSF